MREKCVSTLNSKSSKPSLPRMLRMAGGQVEIVESEATQTNFLTQTKRIIPMIKRTEGFSNNRWKMILMVPGLYVMLFCQFSTQVQISHLLFYFQDITIGGDVQRLTDEVIQSVEVIAEELPDKTMVVIVRNSKFVNDIIQII